MEIYGKLESIASSMDRKKDPAFWHPLHLQSVVHLLQGTLSLNLGEFPNAENELKIALTNLEPCVSDPRIIVTAICIYNELGRLWWERKDFKESEKFFLKTESAARDFIERNLDPYSLQDLFTPGVSKMRPSGRQQFNHLHNEALHHLSLRGINPGPENFAREVHHQIQELLASEEPGRDIKALVTDIRSLVTFFSEKKIFEQARQYLSIADWIAGRNRNKEEELKIASLFSLAKIDYFLALMKASTEKLQERKRALILARKEETLSDQFNFDKNSRNIIVQYVNQYPTLPGRDWNETIIIFAAAKKEVDFALKYFTLETNKEEHVWIKQQLSKMYKYLTAFQYEKIASIEAVTKLSKLHRRRVKCLEGCLVEMKIPDNKLIIQELTFELADIYLDKLELKQKKFERTAGNLDPRLLQKMAYFCFTGIKHCQTFLDSLNVDGKLPSKFPEDTVKPAMVTIFRMARFYNKVFTPIREDQNKFTKQAIEYYQKVVDYCTANPDQTRKVDFELNQSISVIDLLERQLQMHAKAAEEMEINVKPA